MVNGIFNVKARPQKFIHIFNHAYLKTIKVKRDILYVYRKFAIISSLFNSKFPNKFTFVLCYSMTRCDIECIIDSSDR